MRQIGRIILLVVGILMLVFSVPTIIVSIKAMNNLGWENFFLDSEKIALFSLIVTSGIDALFGLVALWGGIRKKKSLRLALCAIIMAIAPTIAVVNGIQSGSFSDINFTLQIIGSYALPIFYFIGFMLV